MWGTRQVQPHQRRLRLLQAQAITRKQLRITPMTNQRRSNTLIKRTIIRLLRLDTVNGVFGQTVSYDPTDEIKALEAKGYQLVSNGVKNNQITFTNGSNQVYQIVLKHGTTTETPSSNPDNLDLTKTVSRTINYQYQNGSQAANPVTNSVTFTRTATKDNVTARLPILHGQIRATLNTRP